MGLPSILILAVLIPASWAFAQGQGKKDAERPVMEYTGEPMALPVNCTNDAIASFGLVCPPERPCPVYLELTSVEFVEGKLYLAGNLHSESTTLYSVLLASEDGGLNWTEPHERIPHAGLDRVAFYDDEHGWAAGHVLDGQPRDPFFLITTDGGRFWRKREVYDDTRRAVIEDFWFDSGRSGVLLIDRLSADSDESRYERYETMTGAESWMIREVSSQPIQVRRRPLRELSANWRVTPDQEIGAWQVQKRDPAGWVTVSQFQIEPGVCAEQQEILAEAQPEPEPAPADESEAEAAPAGELPVAPGGVFVIGSPPPQETGGAAEKPTDTEDRPTIKKPQP